MYKNCKNVYNTNNNNNNNNNNSSNNNNNANWLYSCARQSFTF